MSSIDIKPFNPQGKCQHEVPNITISGNMEARNLLYYCGDCGRRVPIDKVPEEIRASAEGSTFELNK